MQKKQNKLEPKKKKNLDKLQPKNKKSGLLPRENLNLERKKVIL